MEQLLLELFSHPDIAILGFFHNYGVHIYRMMFIEFFVETAFIPASFLPWDGILFMIGALSLQVVGKDVPGSIDMDTVFRYVLFAGILGDVANYYIGKYVGKKMIGKTYKLFGRTFTPIREKHIEETKKFIGSFGHKAFMYGRILPVFRNIVPFVAGVIHTDFKKFILFDVIGLVVLIGGELGAGMLFGRISRIKNHISLVTLIFVLVLIGGPMLWKRLMKKLDTKVIV